MKGDLETEFDRLNDAAKKDRTLRASTWYRNQLRNVLDDDDFNVVAGKRVAKVVQARHKPYVGGMYQYAYDAKTKKKLPYWDAFPLVIPIELYDDGFLGLNLHYLPVKMRIKMLDKLLHYSKTIRTGGHGMRTYMQLSYSFLRGIANLEGFDFMLKRYLYSHVKSRVMQIHFTAWSEVAYLPTQQFRKQSEEVVWADARRHMRQTKKRRKKK